MAYTTGTVENRSERNREWKELCTRYHHHFVRLQTRNGDYEGIVVDADDDNVWLLIPVGDADDYDRQYYPYYGGTPYGGYYPYGYGYPRRFRRFARFAFPYLALSGLLFPYFY